METERHEQAAVADGRLPLPRQTTPTWEVELLLSAGLVFALFQVPEPLHRWAALASARLGDAGDMLASMSLVYALMAVYALVATFLVHLTARAYWVALVGIDSVYPDGIRWEKFSGGPISRAEMQRQIPSFHRLVERADNLASLCFAFGLAMVMSSLLGAGVAMPLVGIAIVLSETILQDVPLHLLLGCLLLIALLPLMGLGLADKLLGKRNRGPPPGWFARLVTAFQRLPLNRLPAPLILMLATNQRGRRAYILFGVAMTGMMLFLVLDTALRRGDYGHVGYDYVPEEAAAGAYPQHYRELRQDALLHWSAPSIQSMVVQDGWLRLLVPWDAERHEPLAGRACGGDSGLAADLEREAGDAVRLQAEQRLLECLAGALQPRVDGVEATSASHAFSEDPGTGLPAILVMIPVGDLAAGRHELTLQRFPKPATLRDADALQRHRKAGPLRIPFWR